MAEQTRSGENESNVAIIGAGPYGLAAAAHLRAAGVETVAFGEPMSFWERNMPTGMLLRSSRRASSIADPHRRLTVDDWERETGVTPADPLPLENFIAYAHWFRGRVLPDCDTRKVARVDTASGGFTLTLADGETLRVKRVVVAAGIAPFAAKPEQFATLPPELASHSSDVHDVDAFAGRRVLVVGAGQSALEDAALLSEAGAEVELLARAPSVRWLQPDPPGDPGPVRRVIEGLSRPPSDFGPPGLNWIGGVPDMFRRMPRSLQPEIAMRCIRPAASAWLAPRVTRVTLTTGRFATSAVAAGDQLEVVLDDGSQRQVDHAVLATGYRVDVSKYGFLGPELLRSLHLVNGYPRLSTGLESSIPGLYFLGAPAAATFGPAMRFVTGNWYAAPAMTRKVTGRPPLVVRPAW
jgi:FAD-dependent urate hydroxylase